jgi:hypothetical protein
MAVPWLRIFDLVLGVTDLARSRPQRQEAAAVEPEQQLAPGSRALGHLETRLAGVVVAALREAFDRDTRRLELEREQIDAERRRAERALRLELIRQAGDREIGRLRLIAGVAIACWIGTLFFSSRLMGGPVVVRVVLGCGWAMLLAAIATAFAAQTSVARALARAGDDPSAAEAAYGGVGAALAPWLVVAALALVGVAVLL